MNKLNYLKIKEKKVRNDFKFPRREHLTKGELFPIYENWREEKILLGYARLNKRVESNNDELTYTRVEIGSGLNRNKETVIWCFERWNITYVDPWDFNPDFTKQHRFEFIGMLNFTTEWNLGYYIGTVNNEI